MTAKNLMIQGTASSVGKSLITAAFCRIFRQDGYSVAPFKSQNMALNSFITSEGKEMGRAQVVQAEAAGLAPHADMNPILLKPTTDRKAQVILNGTVYRNMSAMEYHEFKPQLAEMVKETYMKLASRYDMVVLEGAGSPAEINLRERDLVNMGMAEMADAPVILVGDIDRGGVFASIAGTMLLLQEEEKKRVKGVIINKFRGDVKILEPGLKMLEDIIKIPVLGVIPYTQLKIEDEDSVTERFHTNIGQTGEIKAVIVRNPHISNFTDFNALENIPGLKMAYTQRCEELEDADLVILPGSKNTIEDLLYLRKSGLEAKVKELHRKGAVVLGICGGYQMLGGEIHDPFHTESNKDSIEGMGLLNICTAFQKEKITTQVRAAVLGGVSLLEGLDNQPLEGYEIHMGTTEYGEGCIPWIEIQKRLQTDINLTDGVRNSEGTIFGTYLHGIFDNTAFTIKFINNLRKRKGLPEIPEDIISFREMKEKEYDRLAQVVRDNVDMKEIYRIVGV